MRRLLITALGAACLLTTVAAANDSRSGATSWAKREIQVVVGRGLMGPDVRTFRPDDPLTRGELTELTAGLRGVQATPAARAEASVTMVELDRRLVGALSLGDAAAAFAAGTRAAGLKPPSRFGTEVVARLLGLRTNHSADREHLERLPSEPAPRAEAAYSAARILALNSWTASSLRTSALAYSLPQLDPWQKRILQTAVSLIGYPYVWGGTSEQLQRGFDCSGFVWRVYKLQRYPGSGTLAQTLRGRTTFTMSAEVPRALRIGFASLSPGDLVFFGSAGPRSKPAQVDHMGIYLGNEWMIHSSGYGVALVQLRGWYRERFAWARRPLAEAGLSAGTIPATTPKR